MNKLISSPGSSPEDRAFSAATEAAMHGTQDPVPNQSSDLPGAFSSETGLGVLLALLALSIVSLLGLILALGATTEVRISDNSESRVSATYAALAGIEHGRELLRGLDFNDQLPGPDGIVDTSSGYTTRSRSIGFRNIVTWAAAHSLSMLDPSSAVEGLPDDGLLNTGKSGGMDGLNLVPMTGVALRAPNPYGSGSITTARYFIKIADNNGEASELEADPADDPFFDGDGIVILRSMGIAQTILESLGSANRRNSVVVYEGRYRRSRAWELEAPLIIQGDPLPASEDGIFKGSSFRIDGGPEHWGLATIDTTPGDGESPSERLLAELTPDQSSRITGKGRIPSIVDITSSWSEDRDKSLLLGAPMLWRFATDHAHLSADTISKGNQKWTTDSFPDLGSFDRSRPSNDPSQRLRMTVVDGDLEIYGRVSGAGILLVRGGLSGSGSLDFTGLVLVIGEGEVDLSTMEFSLAGAFYVARVTGTGGGAAFGMPRLTVGSGVSLLYDHSAVKVAAGILPPYQTGFREVTATLDPP